MRDHSDPHILCKPTALTVGAALYVDRISNPAGLIGIFRARRRSGQMTATKKSKSHIECRAVAVAQTSRLAAGK